MYPLIQPFDGDASMHICSKLCFVRGCKAQSNYAFIQPGNCEASSDLTIRIPAMSQCQKSFNGAEPETLDSSFFKHAYMVDIVSRLFAAISTSTSRYP